MQSEHSLILNLQIFWLFLSIGILITILRIAATRRYRAERTSGNGYSNLGRFGKDVVNTPFQSFNILHSVTISLSLVYGLEYFRLFFGFETAIFPMTLLALGTTLALILYCMGTVRGRAQWRTGRIVRDHQQLGHQDWVIQKRLAELAGEIEKSEKTRVEVAQHTLDKLVAREDMTGDAVRRIIEDPELLAEGFEERKIPSPIWQFKFSLLLISLIYITLVISVWGLVSGFLTFQVFSSVFLYLIGFTFALICCVSVEGASASKQRRKLQRST